MIAALNVTLKLFRTPDIVLTVGAVGVAIWIPVITAVAALVAEELPAEFVPVTVPFIYIPISAVVKV